MTSPTEAIKQRIEAARTELGEIAKQWPQPGKRFRMSIPAQPDRDSDLIIGRALKAASDLVAEVERLKSVRAVAVEILGHFHQTGHPGGPCRRTGWIPEQQIEAWRAALDHPTDTTEAPPKETP